MKQNYKSWDCAGRDLKTRQPNENGKLPRVISGRGNKQLQLGKVMLLLLVCCLTWQQSLACGEGCATSVSSFFNATSISAGRKIWFNASLKVSGYTSYPVTIYFTGQVISSRVFSFSVPDGELILDPSVSTASTTFDGTKWITVAPPSISGYYFISGYADSLRSYLPGGLSPVSWSGTMRCSRPSVSVAWQWAAAVYTSFNSDMASLGVKASDCSSCTVFSNTDRAGTPENYRSHVTSGARGYGGSNYTGSFGAAALVSTCTDLTIPGPAVAPVTGAATVCIDASTTLSDVTSGGTWHSSNTAVATVSSTGIVTGISAGTATISYSIASPGLLVAAKPITVNPLPLVAPITGDVTTICAGDMTSLADATAGGAWSCSNPTRACVSSTGLVTSITWGTVTISYTVSNSCGSVSATQTVVMNAVPAVMPVTGGGAYCVGGSGVAVTLPGSAVGINYQLYRNDTAVGSPVAGAGCAISLGVQSVPGTYTVGATNPSSGCYSSMSGSTTISIAPLPDVFPLTGGGSYCADGGGVHITLSGSDSSTNYELLLNGVPLDSFYAGTGGALDFGAQTDSGVYTVHAASTVTGCAADMSGSASVSVISLPYAGSITGPSSVHNGSCITLADAAGGGIWLSSDNTIVSIDSATGIATGVSAGYANITYEVANTCGTAMAAFTVHDLGGHEGERMSSGTSRTSGGIQTGGEILYPNPNIGAFTLSLAAMPEDKNVTITITDMLGRTVYQSSAAQSADPIHVEPLTPLENGTYLVKLECGATSKAVQMVVQR